MNGVDVQYLFSLTMPCGKKLAGRHLYLIGRSGEQLVMFYLPGNIVKAPRRPCLVQVLATTTKQNINTARYYRY